MKNSTKWMAIGSVAALALWSTPQAAVELEPESKVWLIGDSTMHAYSSTAHKVDLEMQVAPSQDSLYETIRAGGMKDLEVTIPVAELKSGKTQLDRNMHRALRQKEHPEISFHLTEYEVFPSTLAASFPLAAKGELIVAGQRQDIELGAFVYEGNPVRIQGEKEIFMTDYGVKPPTIMGMIKTNNRVIIHFDLFLKNTNK